MAAVIDVGIPAQSSSLIKTPLRADGVLVDTWLVTQLTQSGEDDVIHRQRWQQ